MGPQGMQLFALGAGWAVGLVFSIAAIGGIFSIAGRVQKRLKRGRKCRFCGLSGRPDRRGRRRATANDPWYRMRNLRCGAAKPRYENIGRICKLAQGERFPPGMQGITKVQVTTLVQAAVGVRVSFPTAGVVDVPAIPDSDTCLRRRRGSGGNKPLPAPSRAMNRRMWPKENRLMRFQERTLSAW